MVSSQHSASSLKVAATAASCWLWLAAATCSATGVPPLAAGEDHYHRRLSVSAHRRHLQNCEFSEHGYALECTFSVNENQVRYLIPCPANATSSADCLTNEARLCYLYNGIPCVGSYYCQDSDNDSDNGSLALDCSNIYAKSEGDSCSVTDCDGGCVSLAEEPVDYNTAKLDNACVQGGFIETTESVDDCDAEEDCNNNTTTKWYDILADGTEIWVTTMITEETEKCTVETVAENSDNAGECKCSLCSAQTLEYDCSEYSNDPCAVRDCDGNCIASDNGGGGGGGGSGTDEPTPVASPVSAPVNAPVAEPVSVPVSTPVSGPVEQPVFAPVAQPVSLPASSPVSVPVTQPVSAPVSVPVDESVSTPVVELPVSAPVRSPSTSGGGGGSVPTAPTAPVAPTPPSGDETGGGGGGGGSGGSDSCSANSGCQALSLEGLCCPTTEGLELACCGTPVQPKCENNPACKALGLGDDCCPTKDGVFLDCCTSVPDECHEAGSCDTSPSEASCELFSECAALGLEGVCCPTADGHQLACCGTTPVQPQCVNNPACSALGLGDDCCPTVDNVFLDCCTALPNECQEPGSCDTSPSEASCELNPKCEALNLEGNCCPTAENITLDCCEGVVRQTSCEDSSRCNALGLEGACCPTDGSFGYLDCCDSFPVDCKTGGSGDGTDCTISSSTEYMEFVSSNTASGATQRIPSTVGLCIALLAFWSGLFL